MKRWFFRLICRLRRRHRWGPWKEEGSITIEGIPIHQFKKTIEGRTFNFIEKAVLTDVQPTFEMRRICRTCGLEVVDFLADPRDYPNCRCVGVDLAEGPDRSVYGTSPVEILLLLQSALRSFPPNDEEKP